MYGLDVEYEEPKAFMIPVGSDVIDGFLRDVLRYHLHLLKKDEGVVGYEHPEDREMRLRDTLALEQALDYFGG